MHDGLKIFEELLVWQEHFSGEDNFRCRLTRQNNDRTGSDKNSNSEDFNSIVF